MPAINSNGRAAPTFDLTTSTIDGLNLKPVGDGVTSFATVGGRNALKLGTSSGNGYAYFDVDDGYMFNGSASNAAVSVEYYDQGYGYFYVDFDALDSASGTARHSFGPTTSYFSNNGRPQLSRNLVAHCCP